MDGVFHECSIPFTSGIDFTNRALMAPMAPDLHLKDRHCDRRQDLIPVASDQNGIF